MSLLQIRTFPDSVLREMARPVEKVDYEIIRLAEDMLETMYLGQGIGLAANQVGVPVRLIVLDPMIKGNKTPIVVLNPEIVERADEAISEEGCLSVPGFYEFVKRSKRVCVRGMTIDEKPYEFECDDRLARAFQHEIDHLDGVLFIDLLSPMKKELFKKRYKKRDK